MWQNSPANHGHFCYNTKLNHAKKKHGSLLHVTMKCKFIILGLSKFWKCSFKGAFTLGVRVSSVKSTNIMLLI
jgi:hypothetical protein